MENSNEKRLDESESLIEKEINKLKKDFEGLTEKQKALLGYRKIIELAKQFSSSEDASKKLEDEDEKLISIIMASEGSCGFLKSAMLYVMSTSDRNNKIQNLLYRDSIISYNRVLENYMLLAKELKIDKALDLSHLFTYMLWNGYYSVSKTHCYKLQDRLLLPNMHSFDVIKGQGVCLAYAELLRNYLTTCDKKASLLQCKVPTRKNAVTCNYRPEIERNVSNSVSSEIFSKILMLVLKGLVNKIGNHAVTLIEENGKLFIYDPTNLYVLNVIDDNFASLINGKGMFEIKAFTTLMLHPDSDPNHLFEKLVYDKIEPAFSRKEIIFSFEKVMEIIESNISLLDDAYDNIHNELEFIDKQTDIIGGHYKALKKIRSLEEK